MDLVTRWADDLAHEIKNPLHAMVINLELVKRRAGASDPNPIVERAEIVEAELHRVHQLVDALLRIIRPWPDVAVADPEGIMGALLPVIAARCRIRKLDYMHEPGGSTIALRPEDFALIMLNLLDNAIEATPEGGHILTRCDVADDHVKLSVTDSGAGLEPEGADRLREPGVTSREGRTGLGLSVVDRLARDAGGSLSLETAAGDSGAVVTVVLPRP